MPASLAQAAGLSCRSVSTARATSYSFAETAATRTSSARSVSTSSHCDVVRITPATLARACHCRGLAAVRSVASSRSAELINAAGSPRAGGGPWSSAIRAASSVAAVVCATGSYRQDAARCLCEHLAYRVQLAPMPRC